jgi:hypothetical protein
MDERKLTIKRVDNGYLVSGITVSNTTGESFYFEEVIEDGDTDTLTSHYKLLYTVMEYFNFGGSKHDPERIRIIREKQNDTN